MKFLKLKLLVLVVILFAAGSAFASYSYEVTVNTSSLTGSGLLDFQYNSSSGGSSTATVSNFTTDGILAPLNDSGDAQNPGAVSGVLPNNVVFTNPNLVNEYIHAITFGNAFSFLVTLSNPGSGASNGYSTFSLGVFDTGFNPLLNTTGGVLGSDSAGTLFTINLYNGGTATSAAFDPSTNVSPTPIPPTVLLFGSGLLGLVGIRRKA